MNTEQKMASTVMLVPRMAMISLRWTVSGPRAMTALFRPNDLGLPEQLGADRQLRHPGRFDVDSQTKPVFDDEELDDAVLCGEKVRLADRKDVSAVEGSENLIQPRRLRCAHVQDVAGRNLLHVPVAANHDLAVADRLAGNDFVQALAERILAEDAHDEG